MKRTVIALTSLGAILLGSTAAGCGTSAPSADSHASVAEKQQTTFIGPMTTIDTVASTVPHDGDVNPYGVAVVPTTKGRLVAGNVLVSNFNDRRNLQGTGKTIVQVSPSGVVSVFASIKPHELPGRCPGGIGLTTALAVLRSGWVVVGSLPTKDGTAATARAGCLIVLDAWGRVVRTISGGPVNGPWDMTALDGDRTATLFVTNVLDGTVAASPDVVMGGTVVRITLALREDDPPCVVDETTVASGFGQRTDPAALVLGPTGLALGCDGTLFVADTLANRIAAIPDAVARTDSAGTGTTVSQDGALVAPLGLAMAPNGDLLSVNGGDGNMVETTQGGSQVAVKAVDVTGGGAGDLFGLAAVAAGVYFVNDGNNTLDLLH